MKIFSHTSSDERWNVFKIQEEVQLPLFKLLWKELSSFTSSSSFSTEKSFKMSLNQESLY